MERRTVVRLLLVFGIGIPLLVEGLTLLGLVSHHFGGDASGADTPTATPVGTPTTQTSDPGVGVGDDLLPATAQNERLTTATISGGGDTWTLTLAATVENTAENSYSFTIGPVELADGTTLDGTVSTGTLEPGTDDSLAKQWQFPAGGEPTAVTLRYTDEDGTTRTTTVRLAPISVDG